MVCNGGRLVFLEPSLNGLSLWLAGLLILAITVFAVISFWVSPVAAPLSSRETEARGSLYKLLWVGSFVGCFALISGLVLVIFPIDCARHAVLVSAYAPPGVDDWDAKAGAFVEEARKEAAKLKLKVQDLAPVRDRVLDMLRARGNLPVTTEVVSTFVRKSSIRR